MTILSTIEASRIRNLAMSALHHIAADALCEVPDIIALITPTQPEVSSHAPAAQTDGEVVPPASPSVEPPPDTTAPAPSPAKPTGPQAKHVAEAPTEPMGAGGVQDRCESTPPPIRGRKETTRAKVVSVHAEHPDWPSKLIAQHLGISEDAVRATASRKKLKLVSWWDYERGQRAQTTEALKSAPAKPQEAKTGAPAPEPTPPTVRLPAAIATASQPPVEADAFDVLHRPRRAPTGRFYLMERGDLMATRRYVHQSLSADSAGTGPLMTTDRKWAWFDTIERYRGAKKKWPQLAQMRKEAANA